MKNRITFKVKTGYYLELLTNEMMKLLESTEKKFKKGNNIPYLEIIEVVLVYCNIVNNGYQLNSRVLHTFVSSKQIIWSIIRNFTKKKINLIIN